MPPFPPGVAVGIREQTTSAPPRMQKAIDVLGAIGM